MKLGPYDATLEGAISLGLNAIDAQRVRFLGIPRMPGDTPVEIAKAALRENAKTVLHAGQGHFKFMWVSDFAKSLRGAQKALKSEYLGGLIDGMIAESERLGTVPSCFDGYAGGRGFEMPYERGDSLPWLIFALDAHVAATGDWAIVHKRRAALQKLLETWEGAHLEDGLIAKRITGDWMDTVLRPSSTYNNICALMMFQRLAPLGLKAATDAKAFEARLLTDRWRKDHFIDYAGTDRVSVDAAVLSLYLGLFGDDHREKMIEGIEAAKLAEPYAMRCAVSDYELDLVSPIARVSAKYHSSIWLHIGLMYLNGLKRAGRDVSARQKKIEGTILEYGNVLEALDPVDGRPYQTPLHATEYGLSMACGQYLELAA